MKVFIKRTCCAQGKHLAAGETHDLPDNIARQLVTMGRAVAVSDGDKADNPVAVRDPSVSTRDPQIAIGDEGAKAIVGTRRGK